MTENRLLGADFVRAAACLLVVAHHLSQRMQADADLGAMDWLHFATNLGGFGVAMFFVLSGFLLAQPFWRALDAGQPLPSLSSYALRRAARILPGFWVALTVTFVLSFTAFGFGLTPELFGRYLAGVFLVADWHWVTFFPVEINGPLWSISFEVTSYLLLPLGFVGLFALAPRLGRGWRMRLAWIVVIALTLLAHDLVVRFVHLNAIRRGWDYGLMGGAKLWMPKYNPFGFFAMFAIGALASGVQVRLAQFRHWALDVLAVGGLIGMIWLLVLQTDAIGTEAYGFLSVPYDYPWFQLLVGLLLATAPSSAALGRVLDNPATRYVARISFGIYVWHYLVVELIRQIWMPDAANWTMTDPARMAILGGSTIIASFAIAHLSYYALEAPIIRWARRLEPPATAVAPKLAAAE